MARRVKGFHLWSFLLKVNALSAFHEVEGLSLQDLYTSVSSHRFPQRVCFLRTTIR